MHIQSPEIIKDFIFNLLDSKKAFDINVKDVEERLSIAKYMVIATTTSSKAAYSIADYLALEIKKEFHLNVHVEGTPRSWILLESGDVITCLFSKEARSYYDIDKL